MEALTGTLNVLVQGPAPAQTQHRTATDRACKSRRQVAVVISARLLYFTQRSHGSTNPRPEQQAGSTAVSWMALSSFLPRSRFLLPQPERRHGRTSTRRCNPWTTVVERPSMRRWTSRSWCLSNLLLVVQCLAGMSGGLKTDIRDVQARGHKVSTEYFFRRELLALMDQTQNLTPHNRTVVLCWHLVQLIIKAAAEPHHLDTRILLCVLATNLWQTFRD